MVCQNKNAIQSSAYIPREDGRYRSEMLIIVKKGEGDHRFANSRKNTYWAKKGKRIEISNSDDHRRQ